MGLVIVLNNVIKITNATHQVIEVENGAPVVRGVDGKDGKSAYEVAVENGFIGTEQEWLESLKGEKGETGAPGSDASVTADSVNLAFASASDEQKQTMRERINAEKSKGVYELIETITLTEDTVSIVRTQEPDGTPYAFKAIGVVVQAEVGSANSGINVFGNYESTRLQAAFINGAIDDSIKKYGYARIYPDWGVWTAIGSRAVNGFGWTVSQMAGDSPAQAFSVKESENPYCTQVTLQANVSGATIPTGTIIQIYGVRA